MNTLHAGFAFRMILGLAAAFVTFTTWAQAPATTVPPKDPSEAVVIDQQPLRQPPTETGIDGKSVPVVREKRVLADPATKRYMPCRDENDTRSADDDAKPVKLNPKASVLTEEAAKQHGYKPSPHKVDCPKE